MIGDVINGYTLTTDWSVVGGMSEVAFAQKDGREWFIKKFISPKYPTSDSPGSERIKAQRKKTCEEFEARQRELNNRIGSKCGLGGNLVYAYDFFRVDTLYYKITEKIDVSSISIEEISLLNHKDLLVILKSLVHSLRIMHKEGIVHGDLKPDNILIKATATGTYTTKLIDFDDSYLSGNPPKDREQVVGTPEYYSPELFDYISDEEDEIPGTVLTTKSDIFALGIIFCEYLTGSKPIIPSGFTGTYTAVKDDKSITFKDSKHLTPSFNKLLLQMLDKNPEKRPDINVVFDRLKSIDIPIPEGINKIIKFTAYPSSAKSGETITIEWDVENAKVIRIDGIPMVKRGKKNYPAKESFTLEVVYQDDTTEERILNIDMLGETHTHSEAESAKSSKLRGSGLKIGKK